MKKNLIVFVFFVILVLFLGCQKYDKKNPYFTFGQVGNEWTYEYLEIYTLTEDTMARGTVTVKIISDDGEGMFTYEEAHGGSIYTNTWYISSTEFGYSKENILAKSLSEKDDFNKGDNYVYSVDVVVEVLGNELTCYNVRSNYSLAPDGTTSWIHPDYGIVKMQVDIVFELTRREYKLIDTNF